MPDLIVTLNKPQIEAYRAIQPGATVFTGYGRGIGKSWFHRFCWWSLVAQYDGIVRKVGALETKGLSVGVLMPTLKQFKDVHERDIIRELDGQWAFLGGKYSKQNGKVVFPGGSTVTPMPAEEHSSSKARGLRVDVVSCDEVDDISAQVYDGVAVPWTSAPWSLNIHVLGGTPTRGRHGLWWRTLDMGRKGEELRNGADPIELGLDPEVAEEYKSVYSFHATYKDAPETVSPAAVAKAKATTPEATFKREWLADPDAGEGLIYPGFFEDFHVKPHDPLTSYREFHVGIDHGDNDPGVMILFGVKGKGNDAQIHALAEWYEPGVLNSIWDQRALDWKHMVPGIVTQYWPDPSRADRIRDWRAMGLTVNPIPKEVKNIAAGIARVREMIAINENQYGNYARFYVDPRCRNLIREMGLYRFKKGQDGLPVETPADGNDHAQDACRYFVSGRFGPASGGRVVTSGA